MKMKKAPEELGKALEDLVEELGEGQQSQQLPVGCVHDVDEGQAQHTYTKQLGQSSNNSPGIVKSHLATNFFG